MTNLNDSIDFMESGEDIKLSKSDTNGRFKFSVTLEVLNFID